MARASDRRMAAAATPTDRSSWVAREGLIVPVGPQPIGDFLPRLQSTVRWIPVRVWRNGCWQVAWIVIQSVELVHVARRRARRGRHSFWRHGA